VSPRLDRVAELSAEVEALRAENARLEAIARPEPLDFAISGVKLTRLEMTIMTLLARRPLVSRAQVEYALYQGDERCPSALSVMMVKIRRKLAKVGIAVNNEYGRGWWISDEGRARLKELAGQPEARN
jgi:DNA-binding response OmpR family regulator